MYMMIFIMGLQQLKKIEIRRLVTRIFERHRTVHKKMPEMYEDKGFSTKKTHILGQQKNEPWNRVHIDHAYISGIGLLLILVDSFSG